MNFFPGVYLMPILLLIHEKLRGPWRRVVEVVAYGIMVSWFGGALLRGDWWEFFLLVGSFLFGVLMSEWPKIEERRAVEQLKKDLAATRRYLLCDEPGCEAGAAFSYGLGKWCHAHEFAHRHELKVHA